jgi:hypothetical protein
LGVEYKLEKNLAFGVHASSVLGTLMNWTTKKDGYKKSYKADKVGEGLQQIQLQFIKHMALLFLF